MPKLSLLPFLSGALPSIVKLRQAGTQVLVCFSTIFSKGNNFHDFLLFKVMHFSPIRQEHPFLEMFETISIFHGCMVWIEKSVTRVNDRHHEACRVMPNSDPE